MATALNRKDFVSDQEVRWCPGCGDYAILAAVQKTMPEFGIAPENTVFISGIVAMEVLSLWQPARQSTQQRGSG